MILREREPLRVAVIFGPGREIRPVWFDWQRRQYPVRQITYSWQERRGSSTVLHFAVSDGANLFELVYDTGAQQWVLACVEADEADYQTPYK